MTEPIYGKISIKVGGEDVILDPSNLKFNEGTLSEFLDHEGSWYDYFGRMLANAEAEAAAAKEIAEVAYLRAFNEYRHEVSSDKRAECLARVENGVIAARQSQLDAERNVKLLKQHLRSFDKAHENAISLGHNLRKEMSMLSPKIYAPKNSDFSQDDDYILENRVSRYQVKNES